MAATRLFVYGTLRNIAGRNGSAEPEQAARIRAQLQRNGQWLGRGYCRGRLYRVGWYPALVPSPLATDQVRGEVFRLLRPQSLLAILDKYEGFIERAPSSSHYLRERATVTMDDGHVLTAWVYRYNRPTASLERIESGDFLAP
jgi:gamma-glutamylcyclotransferase (GGCT)/AIG2-like uncharacterized protein YtfP